jgi:hypothetical protein
VSGIRPVGDQALRQLIPLGNGHRPHRRRRHRREVRVIRRLSGSQVSGVRRGIRIGVVLAGAGQVAPRIDRIAGTGPEEHRQNKNPASQPPCPPLVAAPRGPGFAYPHDRFPDELIPGAGRKRSGSAHGRHNSITADVLDPDWRVTTFDGENNQPPPGHRLHAAIAGVFAADRRH